MNAKAKGTAREHRSIALLEAAGYQCTRAAASQRTGVSNDRGASHRLTASAVYLVPANPLPDIPACSHADVSFHGSGAESSRLPSCRIDGCGLTISATVS